VPAGSSDVFDIAFGARDSQAALDRYDARRRRRLIA
jgi:hypothetical protein